MPRNFIIFILKNAHFVTCAIASHASEYRHNSIKLNYCLLSEMNEKKVVWIINNVKVYKYENVDKKIIIHFIHEKLFHFFFLVVELLSHSYQCRHCVYRNYRVKQSSWLSVKRGSIQTFFFFINFSTLYTYNLFFSVYVHKQGKERKIWFIFKPFLFNQEKKNNNEEMKEEKKVAMVGSKKFQKLLFLVLLCISFLIPVECKRNIHYRENLRSS